MGVYLKSDREDSRVGAVDAAGLWLFDRKQDQ